MLENVFFKLCVYTILLDVFFEIYKSRLMLLQNIFKFLFIVPALAEFTAFDKFDFRQHLGARAPYHQTHFYATDTSFPAGCQIRQAHTLQRHGSRNPSAGTALIAATGIVNLQQNLLNETGSVNYSVPENPLGFVQSRTPVIDDTNQDKLSSSGRVELFDLGHQFFERYNELFNAKKYNIFAADQQRVVE